MDDEAKSIKIHATDNKACSMSQQEEAEAITSVQSFAANSRDSANEDNKTFEAALDETNKKYGDMLKKLGDN